MARNLRALILLTALFAVAVPAGAQTTPDAHAILLKMIARNPSLQTYKSRVHVDVRMTSFPFFAPKLDGTQYYHRPGTFEVVFDRVPSYAKGFSRLFNDVGDAASWEKDQNVAVDPEVTLDGRPMIVLDLTKKIYSTILDHTLAYVDPTNYELMRMEWYYRSGGKIVMTQVYRSEAGYTVLSTQHADIAIPHVRAVADATYATYQTNAAAGAAP
jgi:hypothetical protein